MRRPIVLLVLLAALAAPATATAGWNLSASIGEGFNDVAEIDRSQVNLEVIPSYSFGMVSLDLGLLFHLEDDVDLLVRPGARVDFWLLYLRGAIPIKMTDTDGFDWGLMAGLGWNIIGFGPISLFAESDATFANDTFGDNSYGNDEFKFRNFEVRLGLQLEF